MKGDELTMRASREHRIPLLAFAESFQRIPPGLPFEAQAWTSFAIALASTVVLVALAVAGRDGFVAVATGAGLALVVAVALADLDGGR